jgi:hypothetical protein
MLKLLPLIESDFPRKDRTKPIQRTPPLFREKFSEVENAEQKYGGRIIRVLRVDHGNYSYINPKRGVRTSRDSNNFYTILLDNLPSWQGYPKRSYSVIGLLSRNFKSSIYNDLSQYGDNFYEVKPQNGAKFVVSSTHDALYAFAFVEQKFKYGIDWFTRNFVRTVNYYLMGTINSNSLSGIQFSSSNYDKIFNTLNQIDKEEFYDFLSKKTNSPGEKGFINPFYEDLKQNFSGDWEKYFDELLNPTLNKFYLMDSIDKLYSSAFNHVEVWTDSPCLLIRNNAHYKDDMD